MEEPDSSDSTSADQQPGVIDVKSGSKEISRIDKTPYNTW
jgi:hypothetical protein